MNIVNILFGIGFYLAVRFGADKFVFKQEFDPKKAVLDLIVITVVITVASLIEKKTIKKEGLAPPISIHK